MTLHELAAHKQLPLEFLKDLGLEDLPGRGVRIPYFGLTGEPLRGRIRKTLIAKDGTFWDEGHGTSPYGLGRLDRAKKCGFLPIVEGESDCWTLWHHGLPALGLPGASMANTLQKEHLDCIDRVYILREPDGGGNTFVNGVLDRLASFPYAGKIFEINLDGAKDPSDLHCQNPARFLERMEAAILSSRQLDYRLLPQSAPPPAKPSPDPAAFTDRELLEMTFEDIQWAIKTILPPGSTLIAGRPKVGKSWLVLAFAYAIAYGGLALGKLEVAEGDVLYLALEDRPRRLQSRLRKLLASLNLQSSTSGRIHFRTRWPVGSEGIEQIHSWIKAHPNARLVIVDTVEKLRDPTVNTKVSFR